MERGLQTDTFHRLNGVAVEFFRINTTAEIDTGRHDVDQMRGLRFELTVTALGDALRPMSDERRADATFMLPVLVLAKGRVAHVRPGLAVANVGVGTAGHDAFTLAHRIAVARLFRDHVRLEIIFGERCERGCVGTRCAVPTAPHAFGAATVVLEEEDKRVFILTVLLQRLDEATDALVHAIEHGGENLHAAGFPGFVFDLAPIARLRRNLPAFVKQAEALHLFDTRGADGVVACVVLALVFRDVGVLRMHWPMRGGVGHIDKEWLLRAALRVFGDESGRVVADGVGVVELFRLILRVGEG